MANAVNYVTLFPTNLIDQVQRRYSLPRRVEVGDPENSNSFRIYKGNDGTVFPSVTAVLGETKSGETQTSLNAWKERVGAVEAERIMRFAAARGTRMHAVLEAFLLRDVQAYKGRHARLDVVERAAWKGLQPLLCARLQAFYGLEMPLCTRKFRIAGTSDIVGVFDGKKSIVDLKTSLRDKQRSWIDDYFLQCDTYAVMWREEFGEEIEQLVILMLSEEANEPLVFVEPAYQFVKELKDRRLRFWREFGV